jgi:hypothetical protein
VDAITKHSVAIAGFSPTAVSDEQCHKYKFSKPVVDFIIQFIFVSGLLSNCCKTFLAKHLCVFGFAEFAKIVVASYFWL